MLALAAALMAALAPMADGAPADDARYWNVADELVGRLEPKWSARWARTGSAWGGVETTGNANLLVVHSVAAHAGPRGPGTRRRPRAGHRRPAPRAPAVRDDAVAAGRPHAPGWTVSMRDLPSYMHMAVDSEVVDGLAFAWRAREQIGLSPALRARLNAPRVSAVARSAVLALAEPRRQPDQLAATVASGYADVTGDAALLRHDLARHIAHFASQRAGGTARATWAPGCASTTGPTSGRRIR